MKQFAAGYVHHLALLPFGFATYALAPIDPLAAGLMAAGGAAMWLSLHLNVKR